MKKKKKKSGRKKITDGTKKQRVDIYPQERVIDHFTHEVIRKKTEEFIHDEYLKNKFSSIIS